jgi:hypothetical protein
MCADLLKEYLSMVRLRSKMVFVIALACSACGGNAAPPPATTSAPAAAAAPAASSASPATGFGVPECDDYIKKYSACVDKLAPAAQNASRQALEQSRAAWKQAASTEQGKAALATSCKAASDAAALAMRAQGCSW